MTYYIDLKNKYEVICYNSKAFMLVPIYIVLYNQSFFTMVKLCLMDNDLDVASIVYLFNSIPNYKINGEIFELINSCYANYTFGDFNFREYFFDWLAGFVSGDGSFTIYARKDIPYISSRFIITLHKDDIDILMFIQFMIGCGNIKSEGNYVTYRVESKEDLYNYIIPIFDKHKMFCYKYVVFLNFKEIVTKMIEHNTSNYLILYNSYEETKVICNDNISNSYDPKNLHLVPKGMTWGFIVGFIEAEGYFSHIWVFRYFIVLTQHESNEIVLDNIKKFLFENAIKHGYKYKGKKAPLGIGAKSKYKGNNIDYSFYDTDYIYYYVLPFLYSYPFLTRKRGDFINFIYAVILKIHCYSLSNDGYKYIVEVSNKLKGNSYSTNIKYINNNIPVISNINTYKPIRHRSSDAYNSNINRISYYQISKYFIIDFDTKLVIPFNNNNNTIVIDGSFNKFEDVINWFKINTNGINYSIIDSAGKNPKIGEVHLRKSYFDNKVIKCNTGSYYVIRKIISKLYLNVIYICYILY